MFFPLLKNWYDIYSIPQLKYQLNFFFRNFDTLTNFNYIKFLILNLIYIKFKTLPILPIIIFSALFSFKINKLCKNTMSLVHNNLEISNIIILLTDKWWMDM